MVDCQATAAAPRGHLLEIGWARVRNTVTHPHACLIALPDGEQIPPAVTRITGISEHMMRAAVDGRPPGASCPTKPRVSRSSPRRRSSTSLDSSSRSFARWPPACFRSTWSAHGILPGAFCPICLAAACAHSLDTSVARLARCAAAPTTSKRRRSSGKSWSACSRRRACRRGARSTTGSPHRSSRPGVDAAFGRCRATCGFRCRMRLASIACFGQTTASCTSARRRRSIIGSTATFGSRTACPSDRSKCCRRHARSRSTSHPVRSRPRSSSRTKSSGTDRPTTSRSRFTTARCGSRRRISARVAQSRHHTARSAHLLRPRRSINSWHSLGETARR